MAKAKRETKEDLKKKVQGHIAQNKGLRFEKTIGEFLSKQKYSFVFEKPIGKGEKERFDVFGEKKDSFWGYTRYYVIECKNKVRVTRADVEHFMNKVRRFCQHLPKDLDGKVPVEALLAYTGVLPDEARRAANGFKPSIKFKKF